MPSVLKKPIWALTPLRYIGGKSKIVSKFFQYFPVDFEEYREPFLGGGSVFLFMKQVYPEKKFWINDFNKNLFYFWITLQSNAINLQKELLKIKVIYNEKSKEERKQLNIEMKNILYENKNEDIFEKALAYYICNKTSFSGLEVGKFSNPAFEKNFTIHNINKFLIYSELLQNVKITNFDYYQLFENSKNSFLYLDPPYELLNTLNILYGKNGELHKDFEHIRFFKDMKKIEGKFCLSYNNDDFMKERYKNYKQVEIDFQYLSNCGNEGKARKAKELLIMNY